MDAADDNQKKLDAVKDENLCESYLINKDIFQHLQYREYGFNKGNTQKLFGSFVARHMPGIMKERQYRLGNINKVFSSHWLSDKQVVFGTKCNRLMALDLSNSHLTHIPSLKGSDASVEADCPCGIHSVAVNPSRSLLATGAEHTNDLAVYQLPTFDPVLVGECGHTDWIFDMTWVDDEFLVTGSRDSTMALWHVDTEAEVLPQTSGVKLANYAIKKPEVVTLCDKAEKVRAMAFNKYRKEIGVLSLNAYLHIWDAERFTEKDSKALLYPKENVCICANEDRVLYAIGSQSHVTLVDPRSLNVSSVINSRNRGCGIRSVSIHEDIITIGTGIGRILFFDLRADKYLSCRCGQACNLGVGPGWLLHDENYRDFFYDHQCPNAIYTHCYDSTGTRLFTAGGPLPAGLWGNYAGIWM